MRLVMAAVCVTRPSPSFKRQWCAPSTSDRSIIMSINRNPAGLGVLPDLGNVAEVSTVVYGGNPNEHLPYTPATPSEAWPINTSRS